MADRHQRDMFIDGPHRTADGPSLQILSWRLRRLLEAGFAIDLAEGLAADRRMDLHALLSLVERGCPPALAARILSPVDGARQ